MRRIATLLLTVLLAAPVVGWSAGNPLVGRWDFNMTTGNRTSALWLGVTEEGRRLRCLVPALRRQLLSVEKLQSDWLALEHRHECGHRYAARHDVGTRRRRR